MLMALAAAPLGAVVWPTAANASGAVHILIANPIIRQRVALSLEGAAERLAGSECQKVFTEFTDGAGQPLQSRLDALHLTGAEFLTWLRFTEGDVLPLCAFASHIAAFTQPGSRVVSVCGTSFTRQSRLDWQAGEVIVIHELLHALGLGENPPSSAEISRRVRMRCTAEHHFKPLAM
jgi:hypothetical protein